MRSVLPGRQLGWHRAHLQPRQRMCGAEKGGEGRGEGAEPSRRAPGPEPPGAGGAAGALLARSQTWEQLWSRPGPAVLPPWRLARLSGQPAGTMERSCCCWVLNVTKGYRRARGGEGARVRDHSGGSGSVGGAVPVTPPHPRAPAICAHPSAHNKPAPLQGLPRAWHGMSRKSVLKRPLSSHRA